MGTDVHARGPLFDGRASREAAQMCRAIEEELAQAGANLVRQKLGEVLKHPTGYYESHIDATPDGGTWEVHDGGVVYGPWLEGVGSRNRTTRFKGYSTFRRAAQELDRRCPEIARRVAVKYVRRMG